MINFGPKAKVSKKPKKVGKAASRLRRPEGYFKDALTSEDVAEINRFSAAIAKMNLVADARKHVKAKIRVKAKS